MPSIVGASFCDVDTTVVCHGGVMRVVIGVLDGLDAEDATRGHYANCAVETRDVPAGTWGRLLATLGGAEPDAV